MTNILHWRKMIWALVLWSVYIAIWTVFAGSGPAMVALWWLAGVVVFGPLWFATQQHRTHRHPEARRDAG
jgi:hypothetical protein